MTILPARLASTCAASRRDCHAAKLPRGICLDPSDHALRIRGDAQGANYITPTDRSPDRVRQLLVGPGVLKGEVSSHARTLTRASDTQALPSDTPLKSGRGDLNSRPPHPQCGALNQARPRPVANRNPGQRSYLSATKASSGNQNREPAKVPRRHAPPTTALRCRDHHRGPASIDADG